jgi:hypothetical protein
MLLDTATATVLLLLLLCCCYCCSVFFSLGVRSMYKGKKEQVCTLAYA